MIRRWLILLCLLAVLVLLISATMISAAQRTFRYSVTGAPAAPQLLFPGVPRQSQPPDRTLMASPPPDQFVSYDGWLSVRYSDPKPGSGLRPTEAYLLTEADGLQLGLSLDDLPATSQNDIRSLVGHYVTVKGKPIQASVEEFGTAALQVQSVQPGDMNGPRTDGLSTGLTGPQPWITILCRFPDIDSDLRPLTYFEGLMSGAYPSLDHYWREVSYDAINLAGSHVVGWYTLPLAWSDYTNEFGANLLALAAQCMSLADTDVYFPAYMGVNLIFNGLLGPYANGGSQLFYVDGVQKRYGMTWLPPWGYENQSVVAHEMGHGFGLPHSGPAYLNRWDVMSDTWGNCHPPDPSYGCLAQHPIALFKDSLGWLPSSRKYMVPIGSETTIALERLALPSSSGYLMAQIPIKGSDDRFYTVEARRKAGHDAILPGDATIIHISEIPLGWPWGASLIDADGNLNSGDEGAMWTVGEVFTDPESRITLTVQSATPTGFVVRIMVEAMPWQVAPLDRSAVPAGDVSLAWMPVPGSDGYEVQIDATTSFNSPSLIDHSGPGSAYTLTLLSGTYYWRVRALPGGAWTPATKLNVGQAFGDWQTNELVYDGLQICGTRIFPRAAVDAAGGTYAIWQDCRNLRGNSNWDIYTAYRPAGGSWGKNTRVNDDSGGERQEEPAIAVDSTGNSYSVWADYRNGGDGDIYFSFRLHDAEWGPNIRVNDGPSGAYQREPVIAVDASGNAYALWTDYRNDADGDVYFAYRPAGGLWGPNSQVSDDPTGQAQRGADIAVDAEGNAYAAWTDSRNGITTDVYFSSRPHGGQWSPSIRINGDTSRGFSPRIVIDTANNAYVVWEGTGSVATYFSYRPAGGAWTSPEWVSGHGTTVVFDPAIAVDPARNAYVAWTDVGANAIYAAIRSSAGNWQGPARVAGKIYSGAGYNRSLAVVGDSLGNMQIIWEDYHWGGIYASYHPAEGSWSSPLYVNDTNSARQLAPALAIGGDGDAYVAWQDNREDVGDIYFSHRSSDGAWTANERVNPDDGDHEQSGSKVAVDGEGNAYLLWIGRYESSDPAPAVVYASFRPAGGSWQYATIAGGDPIYRWVAGGDIAIDQTGGAHAVWQTYAYGGTPSHIYYSFRPDGGSWTEKRQIDDDPESRQKGLPSIAVGALGDICVVWPDQRDEGAPIYATCRTAGGDWEANLRVSDLGNDYLGSPDVALDGSGTAHVIWNDETRGGVWYAYRLRFGAWSATSRVDDGSGGREPSIAVDAAGNAYAVFRLRNIYFAFRPVNGDWGAQMQVNDDAGTANRKYPGLAVDPDGNVYSAWQDDRGTQMTTPHIYFSYALRSDVAPPTAIPTATSTATSTTTPTVTPPATPTATVTQTPTPYGGYLPLVLR